MGDMNPCISKTGPFGSTGSVRKQGFSLIELMVVVSIVSVINALAMVNYRKFVEHAHDTVVQDQLRQMMFAWEASEIKDSFEMLPSFFITVDGAFITGEPYTMAQLFPGYIHKKGVLILSQTGHLHAAHCRGTLTRITAADGGGDEYPAYTQEYVRLNAHLGFEASAIIRLSGPYGSGPVDGYMQLPYRGEFCPTD